MASKYTVEFQTHEARRLYGLKGQSGDKTMAKDIPALAKGYYKALGMGPETVWPFYVATMGYNPATRACGLFIGGEIQAQGLEALTLPAGAWAKIEIHNAVER